MFPKKDFLKIFIWIASIILIFIGVPILFNFFKPVVIGFLISLILYPLTNILEKKFKFLTKKWSFSLVIIMLLGLISLVIYLLGASIWNELLGLYNNLPNIIASLEDTFNEVSIWAENSISSFKFFNIESFDKLKLPQFENIFQTISDLSIPLMDFGKNLPTILINVIFTFMFSFFFTLEFTKAKSFFMKIIPQEIYTNLFLAVKNIIGGYFLAQVKLLFIMFIVLFIGFLIMKMDYAILLSIFVGFLDLLPFFGTGTFLGPFGIICLIKGDYGMALGCILIYLITFILRRLLEPKFLGDSIGISAFFSLFCMFVGFKLIGLIGFIIGVPIGVIVLYLYKYGTFNSLIGSLQNIFIYFKNKLKN